MPVLTKSLTPKKQIREAAVAPRVYICGFPKSGLHLAELMGYAVAGPVEPKNWLGSFDGNAWTTEWVNLDRYIERVKEHPPGTMLKGHSGYTPDIEKAFFENGTAVAFVYRDLRDVAVSQAYHVLSDKDSRVHPGKAVYQEIGNFEDVLLAVIEGIDKYPGLIERWELYAGWLKPEWVFAANFEAMRLYPRETVDAFIRYVYHRTISHLGFSVVLNEQDIESRVDEAVGWMTGGLETATRRKGRIGDWQVHFTPKVKDAFKQLAGDWLIELGYERDNNW